MATLWHILVIICRWRDAEVPFIYLIIFFLIRLQINTQLDKAIHLLPVHILNIPYVKPRIRPPTDAMH